MARPPHGRFPRPAFCQRGDFFSEPTGIDKIGIKVVGKPLFKFVVAFVLWIADGLKEFGVAPGTSDIFRRAASARLDQARIKCTRFRIDEAFDFDCVFPAVTKIVEVPQHLGANIFQHVTEIGLAGIERAITPVAVRYAPLPDAGDRGVY